MSIRGVLGRGVLATRRRTVIGRLPTAFAATRTRSITGRGSVGSEALREFLGSGVKILFHGRGRKRCSGVGS